MTRRSCLVAGLFALTACGPVDGLEAPSGEREAFSNGPLPLSAIRHRLGINAGRLGQSPGLPDAQRRKLRNKLEKTGVSLVRVDLTWDTVETAPNVFDFTLTDKVVEQARARAGRRRLQILAILGGGLPGWTHGKFPRHASGVNKGVLDMRHYKAFVRRFVRRYRKDIDFYTPWNEPNLNQRFRNGFEWGKIVRAAAKIIKEEDDRATVIGPELAFPGNRDTRTLQELEQGLAEATLDGNLDAVSVHFYPDPRNSPVAQVVTNLSPSTSLVHVAVERATGKRLPLWITELGFFTRWPPKPNPRLADVRSWQVSEIDQARLYREIITQLLHCKRVARLYIYNLRDPANQWPGYGILRPDRSEKRSFQTFTNWIGRSGVPAQPVACRPDPHPYQRFNYPYFLK